MRIGSMFGSGKLLVVTVLVALWSCKPSGDVTCADGVDCAAGQRCVLSTDDGRGMCASACDNSLSCAAQTPVCDAAQSVCRACLPGEDAPCLLRDPQHPRCGGGSCVQCVASGPDSGQVADCQGTVRGVLSATPVCDQLKNACRACARHSECDSGVCAKDSSGETYGVPQGSCVPVEQVMVVNQDLCAQEGPVFCTVKQALDQIDAQHRYIVLSKSAVPSDFTSLQIGYLPSHTLYPLTLIGPLADGAPASFSTTPLVTLGGVAGQDALTINNSHVVVEGVPIRGSRTGIACTGNAQVRVVRSFLAGNDTALLASSGCSLTVEQCWLGRGPDGSAFAMTPKNARGLDVTASDFWVINSVFADNGDARQDGFGGVRVHSLSIGMSRPRSGIINSTFMQQSGLVKGGKYYTDVLCDSSIGDRLVVMNTLLFTDAPLNNMMPEEHYVDPSCGASLHHNGTNDPVLTDDKSLVIPMTAAPFVDAAARNLHLGAKLVIGGSSLNDGGAAAIDLAPDHILSPSTDMDGKPRNLSGGTVSIGAYEPTP